MEVMRTQSIRQLTYWTMSFPPDLQYASFVFLYWTYRGRAVQSEYWSDIEAYETRLLNDGSPKLSSDRHRHVRDVMVGLGKDRV